MNTWFLTMRLWRQLVRQPWYIAFHLMQPVVWLLLYGQLFQRVADLPGFAGIPYVTFLTPGVITMSALLSSGWAGLGMISDLESGVMDRFLVSPVSRFAIISSRLIYLGVNVFAQYICLLILGTIMGARYTGGIIGFCVLLIATLLVGTLFGSLSTALALLVRKQESVIGAMNFIMLPLTFVSTAFMATSLMPPWMRRVAIANPINWSIEASRAGLQANPDWFIVGSRLAFLALITLLSCWLSMHAFRKYQAAM